MAVTEMAVQPLAAQERRHSQMRANVMDQRGRRGEKPKTGKAVARIASGKRKRASLCAIATWASTKGKLTQVSACRALRSHIATIAAMMTRVMAKKICAGNR